MAVREVKPWRGAKLVCGIGHTYAGKVRVVERQGQDMDGDRFWHPPFSEYEPDTCVVCGLKTWSQIIRTTGYQATGEDPV